jgi:LmbE family N-acetylglucosaminyl deacetylase
MESPQTPIASRRPFLKQTLAVAAPALLAEDSLALAENNPELAARPKSKAKTHDEAAAIRSAECEAAWQIMGAKAVFARQIDGAHLDHQVASMLAIRSQLALTRKPRLYFFEVNTGSQTQGFKPDVYVDVSSHLEKKKAALVAHVSQDGIGVWREQHEIIARFRGREAGVGAAETFIRPGRIPSHGGVPELLA